MVESKGPGPVQPPFRAAEKSASGDSATPASVAKASPDSAVKATPDSAVKATPDAAAKATPDVAEPKPLPAAPARKPEIGGPKGPEPTRYGDWEKGGRCIDF